MVTNSATPYNDALFAEVARQPEIDLRVVYGADREAHRDWTLETDKGYAYEVLPGWTVAGVAHLNPSVGRVIRTFAPDAAVLSGSYLMPTMQVAAATLRAMRAPWVYWGEEISHAGASVVTRLARVLLRSVLRAASGVLAIGSRARASYVRAGVPAERIADFRYYADTDAFRLAAAADPAVRAATRFRWGLPPDAMAALYCGQLIRRKGVDTLLRAVARLDAAPPPTHVVIAGDGPERETLTTMARGLAIADRVHWLGFVQPRELPGVFAASDVLAVPSHSEGWGVVVTEAMASGLPVLASNQVNAAIDLVRDGETGWRFPVGDDAALATHLRALSAQPDRRLAMARRGQLAVAAEAPAVAARRFVALLAAAREGRALATV